MERPSQIASIGAIYAVLAEVSKRPRYAFLVLQLVAEAADGRGQAGPYVFRDGRPALLREWLCGQLLPMSEQQGRRGALRARVEVAIKDQLTGDERADAALVDQAVSEQVQMVGRANVSRAISDLVRAGLMSRHYAGYATNHSNRGGGRHAVYVVKPVAMHLLRRPTAERLNVHSQISRQEELFTAELTHRLA